MKFYGLLLLVLFVHCTAVQTSAETPLQLSGEIDRAATPTHKPGSVWVFSLKRRTLWNSPKDHLGSGGIFRILFAGPGARLFRVEDDGPMGIPNNGAFYFALPTKPVLDSPSKHFDFPLFAGKKWENRYLLGGWRWLTAYNEVKSLESITTLTGYFSRFQN